MSSSTHTTISRRDRETAAERSIRLATLASHAAGSSTARAAAIVAARAAEKGVRV